MTEHHLWRQLDQKVGISLSLQSAITSVKPDAPFSHVQAVFDRWQRQRISPLTSSRNSLDHEFIGNIDALIRGLLKKNQEVANLKKSPLYAVDRFNHYLQQADKPVGLSPIDPTKVDVMETGPFSVTLLLDPIHFQDITGQKGILGFHLADTPFIISMNMGSGADSDFVLVEPKSLRDEDRKEQTRRLLHEGVHNILNLVPSLEITGYPSQLLAEKLQEIEERKREGLLTIEDVQRSLSALQKPPVVNQLHQEFAAHFTIARQNNFRQKGALRTKVFADGACTFSDDLSEYSAVMATVGSEVDKLTSMLESAVSNEADESIIKVYQGLSHRVRSDFMMAMDNISKTGNITRWLGNGAERRFEMLIYLLRPTQYYLIGRYLRYKYGRVPLAYAHAAQRVFEFKQRLDTLRQDRKLRQNWEALRHSKLFDDFN